MALLTLNNTDILECRIYMPLSGTWVAEIGIDSNAISSFTGGTSATLSTTDNSFSLTGTVEVDRSGVFLDSVKLRLIGGKNGLGKTVNKRHYSANLKVADVLGAILNDAGESQSTTIDTALLSTTFASYTLISTTAANAIRTLVKTAASGYSWRILPDGTLWIGQESWPAIDASYEYTLINMAPNENSYELGVDSPLITPGINIPGIGNVVYTEHTISADKLRTKVWV